MRSAARRDRKRRAVGWYRLVELRHPFLRAVEALGQLDRRRRDTVERRGDRAAKTLVVRDYARLVWNRDGLGCRGTCGEIESRHTFTPLVGKQDSEQPRQAFLRFRTRSSGTMLV